ncbi:4F2 cell-surface antigen heavy chain-like [Anser cygnoides]|uniref:4F2 cell-surface antigen heavy chain-like n=1 Tax=Anser cygnoides TaxID=8845 RepID=UPI0034D186FB
MAADVEAQPRDVELSALEAEKQPMAGPEAGPEKNGLVKAAGPGEAAGAKFTGLGKEELLRAAAAPGWARARTALLALFWLGWLGMLAAAAAIVARAPAARPRSGPTGGASGPSTAPRPRPSGETSKAWRPGWGTWRSCTWGLLLGPLHPPSRGTPRDPLGALDPELGTEEELGGLLGAAREKGVQVLVELTPAPQGDAPWVSPEVAADPASGRASRRRWARGWSAAWAASSWMASSTWSPPSCRSCRTSRSSTAPNAPPGCWWGARGCRTPRAAAAAERLGAAPGAGPLPAGAGPRPPGPEAAPALLQFLRAGPPSPGA